MDTNSSKWQNRAVVSRPLFSLRLTSSQLIALCDKLGKISVIPGVPDSVHPFLAASSLKLTKMTYRLKAVVGPIDPYNIRSGGAGDPSQPNEAMTTRNQVIAFKKLLELLNISTYRIGTVVQVLNTESRPAVPGSTSRLHSALTKSNIECRSMFTGSGPYSSPLDSSCINSVFSYKVETMSTYFEVPKSQAREAVDVLVRALEEAELQ
jgi:hypothetical protein